MLRVKPEFKFNKCSAPVRDGFFEAIKPFEFGVRALAVNKSCVDNSNLRENTDQFYNYFVKQLMKQNNEVLTGARIKIDGNGNREFRKELGRYLRQQLGSGKIKNLTFADSRRDNLIQLADMAVGAIARSYHVDDRKNHNRWRQMLQPKIEDVRDFQ